MCSATAALFAPGAFTTAARCARARAEVRVVDADARAPDHAQPPAARARSPIIDGPMRFDERMMTPS